VYILHIGPDTNTHGLFTWLMLSVRATSPVRGGGGALRLAHVTQDNISSVVEPIALSFSPRSLSNGCLRSLLAACARCTPTLPTPRLPLIVDTGHSH